MAWTRAAGAAAVLTGALALAGLAGDEAQAPLPPDLGKVPGDAVGFVSVRLGDLWRQAAAQGIPERLARQYPGALEQWRQLVGLPPGDVERCTAVLPYLEVGPGPYPLVFVETAQPYDRAKILANLGGNPK